MDISFRYSDNNKYMIISLFWGLLSMIFFFVAIFVAKLEEQYTFIHIIVPLLIISGFLILIFVPIFLVITLQKYSEKTGMAIINNNFIELHLYNKNYTIYFNEINDLKMSQNAVFRGRGATIWFYVYILKIVFKNKQIKIKASIEESREKHENKMEDVSLKILYDHINNIIRSKI